MNCTGYFIMAGRDQLNKLKSGKFEYKNPYVQQADDKNAPTKNVKDTFQKAEPREKGIVEQNGYLLGRINILQTEIDQLRLDVVTLLQLMSGDTPGMSLQSVREYYSNFRATEEHVLNRIIDKKEAIYSNDMSIDRQTEV